MTSLLNGSTIGRISMTDAFADQLAEESTCGLGDI
jgi:hypothetical protein